MFALILISYLVVRLKNYKDLDPKTDKENQDNNGTKISIEIPIDNIETSYEMIGQLSNKEAAYELCKTCTEKIDCPKSKRGTSHNEIITVLF